MARDGQVLPPVPAPGSNTLCRVVLLSIAVPELLPELLTDSPVCSSVRIREASSDLLPRFPMYYAPLQLDTNSRRVLSDSR